jgi:uncharacterized protein
VEEKTSREKLAIMNHCLLDSGALIAYFDRKDKAHARVAAILRSTKPQFLTTMPVVTEAMHLVEPWPRGPRLLLDFLKKNQVRVRECSDWLSLERCVKLIEKYADIPMDFADASLVMEAEDTGIREILTLDFRGFRTFRANGREAFKLLLDQKQK